MYRLLLLHYSQIWSTAMILLAVVTFAVEPSAFGLLVMRRQWQSTALRREHDVVGLKFNVIGLISGIMLSFVLSAIWGQYTHTDEVATLEGVSLRNFAPARLRAAGHQPVGDSGSAHRARGG